MNIYKITSCLKYRTINRTINVFTYIDDINNNHYEFRAITRHEQSAIKIMNIYLVLFLIKIKVLAASYLIYIIFSNNRMCISIQRTTRWREKI